MFEEHVKRLASALPRIIHHFELSRSNWREWDTKENSTIPKVQPKHKKLKLYDVKQLCLHKTGRLDFGHALDSGSNLLHWFVR
mmetsp:Transcript_18715/g.46322  ORF Transcript_18715/g.46322 Transcript_18715/m.46322 type:complete len:83 (-) Transcript_18715:88-336(-)